MDNTLEALLKRQTVPPPSERLTQRILAAAVPRENKPTLWQALGELLRPAPVAALACSLLLGLIASRHLPAAAPALSSQSVVPGISHNAGSFLYYNGEVL